MADYTTELRQIINNGFDLGLTVNDYPLFDEAYRVLLNAKILRHYEFMEIGQETPARFKEYLNRKMNEIMPLYNQYYKASLIDFNPFYTYDLTTTSTHNIDGQSTGSGQNTSNSTTSTTAGNHKTETANNKDVFSDTPQAQLSIGDIEGNVYATTADIQSNALETSESGINSAVANGTTNNALTSTIKNFDDYTSHVVGTDSARTNASILMEFRTSFINIDMMVIDELKDLFMGVW